MKIQGLHWFALAILDVKASFYQPMPDVKRQKNCRQYVLMFARFPLGESTFVENVGQVGELMLNGV